MLPIHMSVTLTLRRTDRTTSLAFLMHLILTACVGQAPVDGRGLTSVVLLLLHALSDLVFNVLLD